MERLAYILDANAVSDYLKQFEPTTERIRQALRDQHLVYLCEPVRYEVLRGLLVTKAIRRQRLFEDEFAPLLTPLPLLDDDWRQAAQFWADARRMGRQLSDVDLLLAALVHRLDGVLISSDDDFNALSIRRENWRLA